MALALSSTNAECDVCTNAFTGSGSNHSPCTIACGHALCFQCVNILLLSSTKIGRCPYCRELFVATDVRRLHVTFDASATPKSPSLQSSEGARIRPTSYYATNPTAQNTAAYVQHNDRVDYIYEEDIQELYLLRRLAKAWVSSLPEQETTELLNSVDDWKHQPTRSLTKQGSKPDAIDLTWTALRDHRWPISKAIESRARQTRRPSTPRRSIEDLPPSTNSPFDSITHISGHFILVSAALSVPLYLVSSGGGPLFLDDVRQLLWMVGGLATIVFLASKLLSVL